MHHKLIKAVGMLAIGIIVQSSVAFIVYDPANHAENLMTAINSATMVLNQAQQIRNQLQNLRWSIRNSAGLSNYQWQNTLGLMNALNQVASQEQALSYTAANVDRQFKKKYPNYQSSQFGAVNYTTAYQHWNAATLDTLRSSLDQAGLLSQHYRNEQNLLQSLQMQGRAATGRMQILQVSSELSVESVNQLQELKRLMDAQLTSQNAYMAYQVSQTSYQQKSLQSLTDNLSVTFPTYRDNAAFAKLPTMDH